MSVKRIRIQRMVQEVEVKMVALHVVTLSTSS